MPTKAEKKGVKVSLKPIKVPTKYQDGGEGYKTYG
jgi:hypothetical protein